MEDMVKVVQRIGLRWCGHVLGKDDDDWVKECVALEVGEADGEIGPGKHGGKLWTKIWMICT